jgi:hypothetical protein
MKRFAITRRRWKAPACVWLRWEHYGPQMCGLSRRVDLEEFRTEWIAVAKKDAFDTQYYTPRKASRHNV